MKRSVIKQNTAKKTFMKPKCFLTNVLYEQFVFFDVNIKIFIKISSLFEMTVTKTFIATAIKVY